MESHVIDRVQRCSVDLEGSVDPVCFRAETRNSVLFLCKLKFQDAPYNLDTLCAKCRSAHSLSHSPRFPLRLHARTAPSTFLSLPRIRRNRLLSERNDVIYIKDHDKLSRSRCFPRSQKSEKYTEAVLCGVKPQYDENMSLR